jgi:signal transduction histidine kinase
MNQTMRQQRWWQHLSSALLLLICLARAIQDLNSTHELSRILFVMPVAMVMVLAYLLGPPFVRRQSSPRLAAAIWLALLTLLWVALVLVSDEFIWLAFVLWLLAGHVVDLPVGIGFCLLVLALAISIPWLQSGQPHAAAIIGPAVGMLFAFGVSRGQLQLIRLARERADLLSDLILAQDELAQTQREAGALAERTRLSRDIHDTLAQGFASILLLARAGLTPNADHEKLLSQIANTAADNLEESRRIVAALTPAALEEEPLVAALVRLATTLQSETGITTVVESTSQHRLDLAQEIAMLRVAQSGLANIRQHSAAEQVRISVTNEDGNLRMVIADDGVGFDPSRRTGSDSGYGLAAMRSRLSELGGSLDVTTSEAGTTLTATLPVREAR